MYRFLIGVYKVHVNHMPNETRVQEILANQIQPFIVYADVSQT